MSIKSSLVGVGATVILVAVSSLVVGQVAAENPSSTLVINPSDNPALVRDVDNPWNAPFQVAIRRDTTAEEFAVFTVAVPSGKLLVVQHVSARVSVPIGQQAKATMSCQGQAGGGVATHSLIMSHLGTFEGMDEFAASLAVSCYASGSNGMLIGIVRNSNASPMTDIEVSVSGHLH
jgi:hypothetical protein